MLTCLFVNRLEPKKEERPKISYSVFSYMESSVHDKTSFSKEQGKFSGSKSQRDHTETTRNAPQPGTTNQELQDTNQTPETKNADQIIPIQKITEQINPHKRMTVAEMFIKESEVTKEQGKEVTEALEKFDKMDLYKSIFLSDTEDEIEDTLPGENTEKVDFVDVPRNTVRNTSPPRGIFANIDFDELNSWRRSDVIDSKDSKKPEEKEEMEVETYGPKIPDNLINRLESGKSDAYTDSNKDGNSKVHVISSSSDDSWVDVKEVKAKKSKKKKKHKSKDKKRKSKHKKKDR